MYDTYEMFYKGKIWLALGLICMPAGFGFIAMGNIADVSSVGTLGKLILVFCVYSLYRWKTFKQKISRKEYDQFFFIGACKALCDKKTEYLTALKDDNDYYALKELYDRLPGFFNQYAAEVLHRPLQLTKPVSPYTAAIVGTQIGGVAVGMVAAQNAIEKQRAYEKNIRDVIDSAIKTGNALDKATYCYESIDSLISKKENVRDDWRDTKSKIDSKIRKEYKVAG